MYGCTVRTVEAVQPPLCERVCRRSAKRRFTGSHRAWGGGVGGEGLLAVKSAKPCSPPPSLLRSDSHAAWLQTRCPFSEHAVHVAGGRQGERGAAGIPAPQVTT